MNYLIAIILLFQSSLFHFDDKKDEIKEVDLNLNRNEIAYIFLELPRGEAMLVQTGNGQNFLFNTGGLNTYEELKHRLDMFSVTKIDKVIVTKNQPHYTANLSSLTKEYDVEQIVVGDGIKETLTTEYDLNPQMIMEWKTGELHEPVPGLVVKVLHIDTTDSNEKGSMTMAVRYASHQLLYMSIANHIIEEKMIESYPIKAELLKVADFASNQGTSQKLLENVDPQVAVIFHRHKKSQPSQEVIERLNETWIDIYETRQHGNIAIKCSQENYEVIPIPNKIEE